jgi:hypothetical protein
MPEVNENGQTAVVYFMPIQKLITLPSGHQYVFKVDRSISLAWINLEDLDQMLDVRGGCCGNTVNRIIRLASASDVGLWTHTTDR